MSLSDENLKDAHLTKALRHAPDSELVPSEIVRKKVLDYAKQASQYQFLASPFSLSAKALSRMRKPHGYWLAGLLPNIKNWQWAGISSVAVALLAVIMLREQLPEEPVWRESEVKDIAQNTVPAPEKALNKDRVDATEFSAATSAAEAPMERTQEEAKTESTTTAPVLADKDNAVIVAAPTAAAPEAQSAPAPAEQALAKQDSGADAELRGRMESTPASDAVEASSEQAAAKPAAAAKRSVGLVDAGALGVAKANKDIQVGVLRILVAEWPPGKALLDEATGYRVEVVTDLVPEELVTYNQTMRDWFKSQQ